MNYYERHIGDYLKDTAHLSLLEHGVYTRLLDVYYTREGGFSEAECARLIGAKSKDERAALGVVLAEFFAVAGGMLKQGRCDVEIARFKEKQRKAKASADARWAQSERNANALQPHCEGYADDMPHAPVPDTSNQTPDTKEKKARKRSAPQVVGPEVLIAAGFDPLTAAEFIAHKADRKAPLTERAWADHCREAQKAGWTPLDAATKVMAKSWRGFEAKYVETERRGQGMPAGPRLNRQEALEADNKRVAEEWLREQAA